MGEVAAAQTGGRIRTSEVMRYLGHAGQEMTGELKGRIAAGIDLAERTCDPKWVWRAFEVEELLPAVRLAGTSLELGGYAITGFLAGACQVALLACTLGASADRELRRLGLVDPLGQLVFDAACTDLVEWGADRACEEIADYAAKLGLKAGDRFSPGYADLPLDVQADFLEVLQAPKRLGLTASVSNLLVPTKSVTCIVGLYPETPAKGHRLGCGACNIWPTCQMRLRGTPCWERDSAGGKGAGPASGPGDARDAGRAVGPGCELASE